MSKKNPHPSLTLHSLMLAALALPGIQNAYAEIAVTKPQTDLRYTRIDEGKRHYQIDSYQAQLMFPLSATMDLEILGTQEFQTGATAYFYEPANFRRGGPSSVLLETRTEDTIYSKRSQVLVKPRFFGDDYHVDVQGIVSEEEDYESKTAGIKYTHEFNKTNTHLSIGYSYSNDAVKPTFQANGVFLIRKPTRSEINTHRFNLGFKQDLSTTTALHAEGEFIADRGYLDDPYKLVWVWGNATNVRKDAYYNLNFNNPPYRINSTIVLDRRPNYQGTLGTSVKLIQHINPLNSTVHFGYRYVQNTWSVHSHTFTLDYYQQVGKDFEIVPSLRYYAQNEAYFYAMAFDVEGTAPFQAKRLYGNEPASSDYRLGRYGSIAGELQFNLKFLENQSAKFTFLMGFVDRRNSLYWGRKPLQFNPSNDFVAYYGSMGIKFVF